MSMSMDLGTACVLRAGRKHKGRPMVWETCEVREEGAKQFHSVYIVNTNTFGHMPPSHTPRTQPSAPPPPLCMQDRSLRHHFPRIQDQAKGGHSWLFDAIFISSTSLACQSEPEVVSWGFNSIHAPLHLPRMPARAEGGRSWYFHVVHTSSTSLACKSKPEVNVHGLHHLQ